MDIYKYLSIKDGNIQSNNGIFAMSASIGLDAEVVPMGADFMRAINRCEDAISMSILPSGKLKIKSGKFSASINCSTGIFPRLVPEGQVFDLNLKLGEELVDLKGFLQEDNDHLWASGVLIDGQSAKATNNIVVVEKWLSKALPFKANLPVPTIKCLIDMQLEVTKVLVTGHRITFFFKDDKWLSSSLILAEWFDTDALLSAASTQEEIPQEVRDAVKNLKAKNTLLHIADEAISDGTMEYAVGALGWAQQTYSSESLNAVLDVATTMDLSGDGSTSIFYGNSLRGVIARRSTK